LFTINLGRKFGEGAGSPSNTKSPGLKATSSGNLMDSAVLSQ